MQNNKLIAEFMGAVGTPKYNPTEWDVYITGCLDVDSDDENAQHFYTPDEMKYHTSWDWLMPVVERVNNTHSDNYGNHYSFQIGNGFVWVEPHMGSRIFFSGNDIDHKDEPMISKVYRGIVEFIKQYNDATANNTKH